MAIATLAAMVLFLFSGVVFLPESPAAVFPQITDIQTTDIIDQTHSAIPASAIHDIPGKTVVGSLAFVIDDAGNNLGDLTPFLDFPGPLTIAVLPGLRNTAEAARLIRSAGKELFLHQPMESISGSYPGPGAVYTGMTEDDIRLIINRNLDEVWPVAGMNNHEGSKVSMDEDIMKIVLEICRERGIIYLDSRTTADTTAPRAARNLNMFIMERDIFLDNEQNRGSIIYYLNAGLEKAGQQGSAVMIGHTFTRELAPVLTEFYQGWLDQGYALLTVSEMAGSGIRRVR